MSKAVAGLITAALVCGVDPAFAAWSSAEPPARYVEASYGLMIFVQHKPQHEVNALCSRPEHEAEHGPLPVGWVIYGCNTAASYAELCIITISLSLPSDVTPAQIERHERAECAGWRH